MIAKKHQQTQATAMGNCDSLGKDYDDLINLSLGDPDITTPVEIIEAAFQDAKNGHTHYTDFRGDPELIEAISKEHQLHQNNIMVTTSGCHGMWLVLESIIDPGDEVIVVAPYFTPYPEQVKLVGGKVVVHHTLEENGFVIDFNILKDQITDKSKAIIINTPNNPSGVCLNLEVLETLAQFAREHDLIIIADDIYTAYHFEFDFMPLRRLYDKTITICSFSKDYCMTGWRIGYVLADPIVISTMQTINENNVFTAPSISQRAALYALNHKEQIQAPLIDIFKARLHYAYERICSNPYLSVLRPEGSIYLFVNITKTGMDDTTFAKYLLDKAHILVLPGRSFGNYTSYIRLAMTVDIETLKEAFDRIDQLLGGSHV